MKEAGVRNKEEMHLITIEKLKPLLNEIKARAICISVCNSCGRWSDQFYEIEEIKDLNSGHGAITALILYSNEDSRCIVIDIRSITGIRLSKSLPYNGMVTQQLTLTGKKQLE